MTKLPPSAKRVTINGNPYIAHEDGKGNITRLEDDYAAINARKPVNQQIAMRKSNKIRVAKRGQFDV